CGADGVGGRQRGLRVAFLGTQLAPHLRRCQAGIQTGGAELWVSLALAVDDGLYIRQEVGEMLFPTLAPTQGKAIDTDPGAVEFVQAFTNGDPPPPQCACGALLPAWPQFFDGTGHK